jgi:peptide/nickel transport system permease protein
MTPRYLARRLLTFLLVVWVAASVNFLMPRLAPGDPIGAILEGLEAQGQVIPNSAELIAAYRERFGLDDSLGVQYLRYLRGVATFDLGYSLSYFPATVWEIIGRALPWTLGLLLTTTLLSFAAATILGALFAWRGTPGAVRALAWVLVTLGAIPYYLLAIILIFVFGYTFELFPTGGTARIGSLDQALSPERILDIVYHSTLPALSIILASVGGGILGTRGMMVTVLGEDYLLLAEAKGLPERRIFLQYALRNALLPQITALAISLGNVVSGAILVEVLFGYPGMGYVLVQAIRGADYTLVQGITFILVVAVAAAVLVIDLINPRIDPRIVYERG